MRGRPEEVDAAQETDEERRIAERGERTSDMPTRKMKKTTTCKLWRRVALARMHHTAAARHRGYKIIWRRALANES
jgi:hypothetical protein